MIFGAFASAMAASARRIRIPPPSPPSGGGNTINAASASESDVQAAIAAASAGDTVAVPAGSATWNNLTINKAVRLLGAGRGVTNITLGTGNTVTKQAGGLIRMRGFSMTRTGGGSSVRGWFVGGAWSARPVVVEECDFTASGGDLFRCEVPGGVIFAKCWFTLGINDGAFQWKAVGAADTWRTADTIGSRDTSGENNHYIEDCWFLGGAFRGNDCDDACRAVFRGNRFVFFQVGSHGLDTSAIGVRHVEIYDNDFLYGSSGQSTSSDAANISGHIWARGGLYVIHGNRVDSLTGPWGDKPEIKFDIRAQQDNSGAAYGLQSPPAAYVSAGQGDYPRQHQLAINWDGRGSNSGYFVDPIYMWGNTGTGASSGGFRSVANGGSWGSHAGYFNSGRDFIVGTARPGYTAYTYPHPLRETTGKAT